MTSIDKEAWIKFSPKEGKAKRVVKQHRLPSVSIEHLLKIHPTSSADGCLYCHKSERRRGYKTFIHEELLPYRLPGRLTND